MSSSSRTPSCAFLATGLVSWVCTTMPSVTVVVQAVSGLRWPSTSTMHWRQAPTGSSSGWSQNRGTWMPTSSAARMTQRALGDADLVAVDGDGDQVGTGGDALGGAGGGGGDGHAPAPGAASAKRVERRLVERAAAREVAHELFPEQLHPGDDRAGGPVAERAERTTEDVVAGVEQGREVALAGLPGLHALEDLDHPVGALAAGRALAAGLVGVELGPAQHAAHDAGGLVEALQRLGAEHRAGRGDALVVERHVEVLGGEQRGGGAARGPELQLVALAHAAGQVEQLAQRDAERGLVLAGALHVPGQAVQRVALALLGAHRR